jgi:hypothetical protein
MQFGANFGDFYFYFLGFFPQKLGVRDRIFLFPTSFSKFRDKIILCLGSFENKFYYFQNFQNFQKLFFFPRKKYVKAEVNKSFGIFWNFIFSAWNIRSFFFSKKLCI